MPTLRRHGPPRGLGGLSRHLVVAFVLDVRVTSDRAVTAPEHSRPRVLVLTSGTFTRC